MRLIDADVFKTEYENLLTWVSHRAEKARLREFIQDIQEQPTVEAIPIEWIKEYIALFQSRHDRLPEELKEKDSFGWVVDVIEIMLMVWEKENEK